MGTIKSNKKEVFIFTIGNTQNELLFYYTLNLFYALLLSIIFIILPFFHMLVQLSEEFKTLNEFINYITIPTNITFVLHRVKLSSWLFLITYYIVLLVIYSYLLFYKKNWSIKINKLLNEYTLKKGFMGNKIKKGTFTNFSIKFDENKIKEKRVFSILFMADNQEIEKICLKNLYYMADSKMPFLGKRINSLLNQFRQLINKEIECLSTKSKSNILIINDLKTD